MKRNSSQLLFFVIIYMTALWLSMRFLHPTEQAPRSPQAVQQQIQTLRQDAEKQIQEARTEGGPLKLSEREDKDKKALSDFDQIAQIDPKGDAAIDARFAKAALLEQMGGANPGYLDQAVAIYKDLKKQFRERQATITVDGKPQRVDVAKLADQKLEAVLAARAAKARSHFMYKVIDALVALTGRISWFSYWFALLLLTVIVKAVLYPFTKMQYKSMHDMQRVAPLIKEAQEKLKGRPAQEIQQRTMAIYRENNVNMAAGCLPAFAQMAALIPLYQMIRVYEYEFRKGTFLWIGSALAHRYSFLGGSLAAFDVPLFLLYLGSMFLSTRMTPPPADPQQAQQQKMMMYMMPLMFGWFMYTAQWPSAFTFYWLVMNVVSTAQQYYILKQHPRVAPAVAGGGGLGSGSRPAGSLGAGPQAGATGNGANGKNGKGSRTPGLDARARARRKSRR